MGIISETICARWRYMSGRANDQARRSRPELFTRWELCEAGHWYDTVTADTYQDAMQIAIDGVDRDNYSDCEGTLYIDVRVRNVVTGESESDTVTLEPDAPDCSADDHDWQSPIRVVDGIKENPGVWGNGGGVIMLQVCAHCGAYCETNTWAQRRDTGERGLTEVSYRDADQRSLQWVAEQQAE